jgi:S1-C subfamily serine protease
MKKRAAVYSDSRRRRVVPPEPSPQRGQVAAAAAKSRARLFRRAPAGVRRVALAAAAVVFLAIAAWLAPSWRGMSQADVDAAIQQALQAAVPPQLAAAEAYEKIRPSVVHVRGLTDEIVAKPLDGREEKPVKDKEEEGNVGTGVVIVDTGVILTNLPVVQGVKRIKVTFADGLESDAEVTGVRPEHDLAVLQAKTIPDDLFAATIRSTNGLRPGDPVVAVGFPFGIGPSTSAGVISGLQREYRSPEGKRVLTNLIQFDAAVNPGNSGGPLVTLDGEVIGIVTGLLNPTEQRVFIGIGFAVPIENAAGAVGLSPF